MSTILFVFRMLDKMEFKIERKQKYYDKHL